jgi:hypothetical protein
MLSRFVVISVVVAAAIVCVTARADEAKTAKIEAKVTPQAIRAAVEKSLPLLMTGAVGHRENRTCFSCHNQGVPILALTAAKERGYKIDDDELGKQLQFIADFLGANRDKYKQGKGQGGQADTAGYALVTLAAAGWKPDETTGAVVEYLLQHHQDRDHWRNTSNRPPTEATPFTTTYVALQSLAAFAQSDNEERVKARRKQVRGWLEKTPAKDTEDRVFRLLGLQAAGAATAEIEVAAKELIGKQRDDGGWAQLDSGEPESALKSDAYATGTALYALWQAGGVGVSDPAYQRGMAYLLQTQKEDGSWHVISRSKPFQTYFETGFPHGNDQFISAASSAWATWALAIASDAKPSESESKNSEN